MTTASGQTVTGREDEIARYVAEVREALADLPADERDELLEDLPAHLAEAAAEDPTPLVHLLGTPSAYAAELRAAAEPATARGGQIRTARWAARRQRAQALLHRLDDRTGRLLGYERFSDFARLLAPAWWLVRGYLAAMAVVIVLDQRQELGLLPRLGGSTIVGLAILAAFVAGSVWLAHRTTRMGPWPRRAIYLVSAMLLLFGVASLVGIDENQRWGWPGPQVSYVYEEPHPDLADVFVVDEQDRLLTDVRLLDQNGNPIDIGWMWCEDSMEYDGNGEPIITYPRCPEQLPFWARALMPPEPTPEPTPEPSPQPSPQPTPTPEPTPQPTATPEPTPAG